MVIGGTDGEVASALYSQLQSTYETDNDRQCITSKTPYCTPISREIVHNCTVLTARLLVFDRHVESSDSSYSR